MMKNTILKASTVALLLTQMIPTGGAVAKAVKTSTPTVATTTTTTTTNTHTDKTTVPVMTDNLFKYGLKKDVDLPVTVTAGGLSYTLEKIMIYETKSATAQALIKKYGYSGDGKYFIWTKITVVNNSKAVVQFNSKDLRDKWRLHFGEEASPDMPEDSYYKVNSKDALWTWKLDPGKKLSTYQAFSYDGEFQWFYIRVDNKGQRAYTDVVTQQ